MPKMAGFDANLVTEMDRISRIRRDNSRRLESQFTTSHRGYTHVYISLFQIPRYPFPEPLIRNEIFIHFRNHC